MLMKLKIIEVVSWILCEMESTRVFYYASEHSNFKARPFRTRELTANIVVLMIK